MAGIMSIEAPARREQPPPSPSALNMATPKRLEGRKVAKRFDKKESEFPEHVAGSSEGKRGSHRTPSQAGSRLGDEEAKEQLTGKLKQSRSAKNRFLRER